ncbi:hypothetical protein [Bifidobacterium adolescentis]|uniref:hypothetical protein n=2 Tax=Bifidobacterium adolescentis TaxID=1680 RepID=UPI0022E8D2D2|nr:hypothetical protein [Bifidobacterium adolescentis]
MMVTNLCTIPSSTITLQADKWVHLTTVPSVNGMSYWVSFDVNVTGGTISIIGADGDINARQRVSYKMIINNSHPISMSYHVKSGSPTVTVTNMLICTWDEYQANKTLLDSIEYFDGDTMPRA